MILTVLLTMAAGLALWLSGSRGALLTALLAGGWLLIRAWQPHWRKLSMLAAGLLLILPIVVVVIRLMVGPPTTVEGERSLLFRGFYWQGRLNWWCISR
ncbi:MAG: hypothetical protein HC898_02415 [Phycisphaerales bacterium]|nr:hypothetical protein [Phycisphaerales bacterium]